MDSNLRSDIVSEKEVEENFDARLDETKTEIDWRVTVANWLSLGALGCLIAGILGFIALVLYAWNHELFPHPNASSVYKSNGGPWIDDPILSDANLSFAVLIPLLCAFAIALLSLLFKLNQRAWTVWAWSAFLTLTFFTALLGLTED